MHLDRLNLDQFRVYERLMLEIPSHGLRIHGRNASGKTSVLEALVMLATTRSSRAVADRDVVRWDSGSEYGVPAYVRLEAGVVTRAGRRTVSIGIELDQASGAVARKLFQVGGETVRAHDLIGVLKCVLFSPEDVELVTGTPSARRRQIDILLSQTDRTYLHALSQYGRVLAHRNRLLRQFARERRNVRDTGPVTELSFWDEQLVASGATVVAYRKATAGRISELVAARSSALVDGSKLGFAHESRLELPADVLVGEPERDRTVVAARFEQELQRVRIDEFRRGMTLIGPHRDDFRFLIDQRDLATFGSRGQQRLGVIAYKLAEIDVIDERSGERPVLLLDDVLSELDAVHRDRLLAEISECGCQVLVTSTDSILLDHPALERLTRIEVDDGVVAGSAADPVPGTPGDTVNTLHETPPGG